MLLGSPSKQGEIIWKEILVLVRIHSEAVLSRVLQGCFI